MNAGHRIRNHPAGIRDLAGREPKQPCQCPQRSGLPGAVRGEERHYLPGSDLKPEIQREVVAPDAKIGD
jgi:hypothetical protein